MEKSLFSENQLDPSLNTDKSLGQIMILVQVGFRETTGWNAWDILTGRNLATLKHSNLPPKIRCPTLHYESVQLLSFFLYRKLRFLHFTKWLWFSQGQDKEWNIFIKPFWTKWRVHILQNGQYWLFQLPKLYLHRAVHIWRHPK